MEKQKYKVIVSDYSNSPGPRYSNQGDHSGEDFYHTILNNKFYEAYNDHRELVLNLDGPDGYASSFLDEAIGNLVYDFGKEIVEQYLEIISIEEPEWIDMIKKETYLEWEKRRLKNELPKKTENHSKWYRVDINSNNVEKEIWVQPS